jgi:hypothetical protein
LGKRVGDTATAETPGGDLIMEIQEIRWNTGEALRRSMLRPFK